MSNENDIIPAGKYPAVAIPIVDPDDGNKQKLVRFGEAGTGTKQAVVTFRILRGERAGETITWFGSMTKESWMRTLESFRYMGWKGDDLVASPLDQEVELEIENEEYNGKWQAKVAWVNPAGGGGGFKLKKPIVGKELADMLAKIRAQAKNVAPIDGPRVDRSQPVTRSEAAKPEAAQPASRDFRDEAPPPSEPPPARGGGGWGASETRTSSYGTVNPDDDIPFAVADAALEPDPRARWSRWP
jgi:hypothetical protein